jgi:hypothetical protein
MDDHIEHGHFTILTAGPCVLWIQTFGAWNEYTARRYVKEFKEIVMSLPGPIARVADLRHWQYGAPEIIEELSGLYEWMNDQPITRQIDLVSSNLALKLHMNKIQTNSQLHFTATYQPEVALSTLREEGWEIFEDFQLPD